MSAPVRKQDLGRSAAGQVTTAPDGGQPVGRAWQLVAAREVAVKMRDRNFLISTGVTLVLILGVLGLQLVASGHSRTLDVAVTNGAGTSLTSTATAVANRAGANVDFRAKTYPDTASAQAAVRDGSADVGLLPQGPGWVLVGSTTKEGDAATYLGAAVQTGTLERNAQAAGTSLSALSQGSSVPYRLLDPNGLGELGMWLGYAMAMVLYICSVLFGVAIANSVVEEKQSRLVEILASAVPVRQLLIGKVAGSSVLAFAQMVLFAGVAVGGLALAGKTDMLPRLSTAMLWFLIFFVVSFAALACVWAVAGAVSTRAEDVQSTSMPITVVLLAGLFGGLLVSGTWQTVASFVPIMSGVAMPIRLLDGGVPWWQPVASLAVSLVAAYAIVLVAEKIYRRALLQTQGRAKVRDMLRAED